MSVLAKCILKGMGALVTLLALALAFQIGLLHDAAFKAADAAGIAWDESAQQTIFIYFPRWACGPGLPPYLLVETDDPATRPLVGTHIRLDKNYPLVFTDQYAAVCRGRFTHTLAMLLWEHKVVRLDGWGPDELPLTGRFFVPDSCETVEPSLEQSFAITELMKPYQEAP